MIKKRQHNRYTAPAISLQDYAHKIIRTGTLLAEYLEFVKIFRYTLTNRTTVNTTCWLVIYLARTGYRSNGSSSTPRDNWHLRMTIYETPTLYERMVNKAETITVVAEYEDRGTFDIQDLGEYLANLPCCEVPSQIILGEREAHKLLSDKTVPIGSLLDDTVSST